MEVLWWVEFRLRYATFVRVLVEAKLFHGGFAVDGFYAKICYLFLRSLKNTLSFTATVPFVRSIPQLRNGPEQVLYESCTALCE